VAGSVGFVFDLRAMKSIVSFQSLYIHRDPVDMRKSINGLCAIVKEEMRLDLRSPSLFIFCNKKRSHMKILYFDRSGFALWLKRLEESKFPWPLKFAQETVTVSCKEMEMILEGINIWSRFEDVHFEEVL
jgi:transposase